MQRVRFSFSSSQSFLITTRAAMKRLALLLILVTFSYLCRAQCSVEYTEQPPTTIDCSPYLNQQFRLRIMCAAMIVGSNDFESFDLYWYRRRSSDEVEENLGTGNGSQQTTNGHKKRILLEGISDLNLAPFSEEMPGDYWCQAVTVNSSGQYLLTESNVLKVLRPENYTGTSVCNSVQFEIITTCASVVQLLSGSSSSSVSPPLSSFLPSLSLSTPSIITITLTPSQSYKSLFTPTGDSSSSTPSTSASSVPEGSSTDAIILTLVGVMVALLALLLLLMAGITITLFLQRKATSMAAPTAAPLQDQAATKCSAKIYLENHHGSSSQTVECEETISLGLSQHPQAMAAENPSVSQIINSMAYETKREHHQTPQKDLTYSHLQHVQTTCDVNNGGQESQYSKLSHHKKELCDHSSQKQGLSSESYGQKNKSCIFDDQQYAEPFPSGPR